MNNMIIAGVFWTETEDSRINENTKGIKIKNCYKVDLYGQSENSPTMEYITTIRFDTGIGHDALVKVCKEIYREYFSVYSKQIIEMHTLNKISTPKLKNDVRQLGNNGNAKGKQHSKTP